MFVLTFPHKHVDQWLPMFCNNNNILGKKRQKLAFFISFVLSDRTNEIHSTHSLLLRAMRRPDL